jgi:predicted  nucleic acid-binding Zn-ribbon protein
MNLEEELRDLEDRYAKIKKEIKEIQAKLEEYNV